MKFKTLLFEGRHFFVYVPFFLSLFVWFLRLIFLFDYVDCGVIIPAYVGAGWLFALVTGFFLLVISMLLSLFKVKIPKIFAVVGLLLVFINVYNAISILIYYMLTPI